MEKFQESNARAKKHLHTADHMLSTTYPLVKDPKILLVVLDNLNSSLLSILDTMLEYERLYKRIPSYTDKFEAKFDVFRNRIAKRYNFEKEFMETIREIKETLHAHKKSPMEFPRKNKFVICSSNYDTKTISPETLKSYIAKTKLYNQVVQNILKNDRIFNGCNR